MSYTKADIARLMKNNPDLATENAGLSLSGPPISADVRRLNPDTAQEVTRPLDAADTLLGHIRTLAPDLLHGCERDRLFLSFRIDLAWPEKMVAVEVDGGQWQSGGGKHGSRRDYEKTRELAKAGWLLLRFTAGEVNDNPLGCIQEIRGSLKNRKEIS